MATALPGKTANMESLHLHLCGLEAFGVWSEAPCTQESTACVPAFSRAACTVCAAWRIAGDFTVPTLALKMCWVPPLPDAGCPVPLVLSGAQPKKMAPGPTGRRAARERPHRCRLGRKARFFFKLWKATSLHFCVSSCRSFYFFLMIKIRHASRRKNIFRQSRKIEERSQYNSTSLRQSP